MLDHTNRFENPASKGTRIATVTYLRSVRTCNRGDVIMNRIQKPVAAVIALTITLLGAAFVTAPMALADMQPIALHQAASVPCVQPNSSIRTPGLRHG